jgi:hypothetical protein
MSQVKGSFKWWTWHCRQRSQRIWNCGGWIHMTCHNIFRSGVHAVPQEQTFGVRLSVREDELESINPKLTAWSRRFIFLHYHNLCFVHYRSLLKCPCVFDTGLYEPVPYASWETLLDDAPTFILEGVSGTMTLIDVVDKESGSCLVWVSRAKT